MLTTGEITSRRARLDALVEEVAGSECPPVARGAVMVACALVGRGEWGAAERMICRAERSLGWR